MNNYYKTLFEIKLMHEYFLTRKDGFTPFNLPQNQRMNFLEEEFANNRESINRDIRADFPGELQPFYKDYELKVLPSYTGFRVVTRVVPKIQTDNSILYEPAKPLPGNPGIVIYLYRRNNLINSYTNLRLRKNIAAQYFFSNETQLSNTSHPFLSGNISPVDNQHLYEQGEIASFGNNDVREFYNNGAGDQWAKVPGSQFASETDRLFVPAKFTYSFLNTPDIKEAEFNLKNSLGEIVSTTSNKSNDGLISTPLDFSGIKNILFIDDNKPLAERIFTLEVIGTNNYSTVHKLIFSKTNKSNEIWGAVHMQFNTSDPLFDLLDANGFLIQRVDPGGNKTPAPIFEIPIKSRSTFWRYSNNQGKNITLINDLRYHLEKRGNKLVTLAPKAITQSNFRITKPDQTVPKFLPNPQNYDLNTDFQQRIYFDIMVPESDLFPVT